MSKKFEIPQAISRDRFGDLDYLNCYSAAQKHAKQLSKAEGDLTVARDLAATLRGFLCDEDKDPKIDECCTADTVVELIEKRIQKALRLISSHSSRHDNLFVAYFDLKGGAS